MSDANKSLVRRLIEEAVNKGNFSVLDEILSPDYLYSEPTVGERRGKAGYRELVTMYRKAFPDLKLTIEEQIAEGDKVVTRMSGSGTHRGELFGAAPTGKQASGVRCIFVTRIANGKLVEDTVVYDTLGMLRQLGVIPTPVAKAAQRYPLWAQASRARRSARRVPTILRPRKRAFLSEEPPSRNIAQARANWDAVAHGWDQRYIPFHPDNRNEISASNGLEISDGNAVPPKSIDGSQSTDFDDRDAILLERVAEGPVRFGQQAGVTPEEMISLLDSGIRIKDLFAFLGSKASGAAQMKTVTFGVTPIRMTSHV